MKVPIALSIDKLTLFYQPPKLHLSFGFKISIFFIKALILFTLSNLTTF